MAHLKRYFVVHPSNGAFSQGLNIAIRPTSQGDFTPNLAQLARTLQLHKDYLLGIHWLDNNVVQTEPAEEWNDPEDCDPDEELMEVDDEYVDGASVEEFEDDGNLDEEFDDDDLDILHEDQLIDFTHGPSEDQKHLIIAYFDLFLSVRDRWKSIYLRAPYLPEESFWTNRTLDAAPYLTKVVLHGKNEVDIALYSKRTSGIWQNAPNLAYYGIYQLHEAGIASAVGFPAGPYPRIGLLTELRLDNVLSVKECLQILGDAVQLKTCRFGAITGPEYLLGNGQRLEVRKLESLSVSVSYQDYCATSTLKTPYSDEGPKTFINSLLQNIKTPTLRHFAADCDDLWSHANFISFLQESGCQLEAVEFDRMYMSENELLEVLNSVHILRVLKFHVNYTFPGSPVTLNVLRELEEKAGTLLEMLSLNTGEFYPPSDCEDEFDPRLPNLPDGAFGKLVQRLTEQPKPSLRQVWFPIPITHDSFSVNSTLDRQYLKICAERLDMIDDTMWNSKSWDYGVRNTLFGGSTWYQSHVHN